MTQPSVLDPASLPVDDNVNPYCFCIALDGQWFVQKGAMVAYYGQVRFEALSATTSLAGMVASRFSSPLYARDWVVTVGKGKVLLGDRGYDLNSYDLDDGNLTVRAANLLAFCDTLELKQSIVPGFLTLIGTGRFIASSNGPVVFLEPPVRVDPQALLGWADCPSPSHHFDAAWMRGVLGAVTAGLGRQSGEERQLDFTGAGTVLLQSSEAVREDPALLATLESQAGALAPGQLQQLVARLSAQTQR